VDQKKVVLRQEGVLFKIKVDTLQNVTLFTVDGHIYLKKTIY